MDLLSLIGLINRKSKKNSLDAPVQVYPVSRAPEFDIFFLTRARRYSVGVETQAAGNFDWPKCPCVPSPLSGQFKMYPRLNPRHGRNCDPDWKSHSLVRLHKWI